MKQLPEKLIRKAHALGFHYLGDNVQMLRQLIAQREAEREGKPPCYIKSYDHTAKECQICDEREACSKKSVQARVDFSKQIPMIECAECDGELLVELLNNDGAVVDYGCTSIECGNTLEKQKNGS